MGKKNPDPNFGLGHKAKPLGDTLPGLGVDLNKGAAAPKTAIPDMTDEQIRQRGVTARYRAMIGGTRRASFVTGQSANSLIGGGSV